MLSKYGERGTKIGCLVFDNGYVIEKLALKIEALELEFSKLSDDVQSEKILFEQGEFNGKKIHWFRRIFSGPMLATWDYDTSQYRGKVKLADIEISVKFLKSVITSLSSNRSEKVCTLSFEFCQEYMQ